MAGTDRGNPPRECHKSDDWRASWRYSQAKMLKRRSCIYFALTVSLPDNVTYRSTFPDSISHHYAYLIVHRQHSTVTITSRFLSMKQGRGNKGNSRRRELIDEEIILHLAEHQDEWFWENPSFTSTVTTRILDTYKQACKRASFALQKGIFYTAKGHLLQCERCPFTMQ